MNWTEGKLARHSRTRQRQQSKQSILHQKEHFARARAGLLAKSSEQNPPSFSISSPTILGRSQADLFPLHQPQTSISGRIHDRPSQVKRRRSSSSPRHNCQGSHSGLGYQFGAREDERRDVAMAPEPEVDANVIREKRRKLLSEQDWAGIRMQKPIPVHFDQSPPGEGKWSRRRRWAAGRARLSTRDRYNRMEKAGDSFEPHGRRKDVRITVGSREVHLGQESSVPQSEHESVASERPQAYGGVAMPRTFLASSSSITDPQDKLHMGHDGLSQRHSSLSSFSVSTRSRQVGNNTNGRRHLEAPVPIRPFTGFPMSLITESLDCDADASMVAQVGKQESPLASSRKEENEVWRRFAGPSDSTSGHGISNVEEPERIFQSRISPGVSTRWQHKVSSPVSRSGLSDHDAVTDASVHEQGKWYDSRHLEDRSRRSVASRDSDVSIINERTQSFESGRSEPENFRQRLERLAGDIGLNADFGRHQESQDSEVASPHFEPNDHASSDAGSQQDEMSDSTDSGTDSIDRHLAGLREVALNLVSKGVRRPSSNEPKDNGVRCRPKAGQPGTDLNRSPCKSAEDPPREAVVEDDRDNPSEKDADDIWYKYVFSDTNTEDLHKQVLADAGEQCFGNLEAHRTGRITRSMPTQSEWGRNLSTTATHGQPSIGTTETGEDLASLSEMPASQDAVIGCPGTTRTTGTVFQGREGSGSPPYAAPSMQEDISSSTTYLLQQDNNDSGSGGPLPSQGFTDLKSSSSSKAVEPPQSVGDNARPKENFRFAPPKLFVGKFSESVSADHPLVAVKPVTMTKAKRGRPKKKARDGRANIKSIPIYHDDPIEEFDELVAKPRVEASLFPALDTEEEPKLYALQYAHFRNSP